MYRLQFGGSDAGGSVSGISVVEYFIFIAYLLQLPTGKTPFAVKININLAGCQ
jgi:hypothetical protein